MLKELIKKLYNTRRHLLYLEGINNNEILDIEDEVFEKLNNKYINGIPISLFLKYDKPIPHLQPGGCLERSLLLTMGIEDATLVRGNTTDLALEYGKDNAYHGWVEKDNWVYDITLSKKFKKERYYNLYLPYNVKYYKPSQYQNNKEYQDIYNTTIEELQNKGYKRFFLLTTIPIILDTIKKTNNIKYQILLNKHLKKINYNYDVISKELNEELEKKISRR